MLVPVVKVITVTTAGTRVPVFSSSVALPSNVMKVMIQAQAGIVYVGDIAVTATTGLINTASVGNYIVIDGGNDAIDLQSLYIDASANGTKATVLYFKKV